MITCDSSVLIAAFARWHESHRAAMAAMSRVDALIEHAAVETFSVLTRLPAPRRAPGALVVRFLGRHFPAGATRLPGPGSAQLLDLAAGAGIAGGAVYDLLIGLTAAAAGAELVTLDRRAVATYRAAGVVHELLGTFS